MFERILLIMSLEYGDNKSNLWKKRPVLSQYTSDFERYQDWEDSNWMVDSDLEQGWE